MRKVIGIIILSILMLVVVGCQGNNNIYNDIPIEDENSIRVEILATSDLDYFGRIPIILKTKVTGEHNKEVQYH